MLSPLPGRCFTRCAARALAGFAFAAAAQLCAAQDGQASNADPPPPLPVVKLRPAPDAKSEAAALSPSPPTAPTTPVAAASVIAVVLPLDAADYARAADAVRAGFVAAAEAAGAKERIVIIAHGDADVVAAFDKARAAGAQVVVGPLVRDHLRRLAASDVTFPWTIALNQLDEGAPLPSRVYTLALAIESDARVIARRARDDGATTVAIVGADSPLMKRFASAFSGEWLLAGGDAPQNFKFDPTPDGLAALRRDMGKFPYDAVIIAAEGDDAALAKSFIPRVTAYASAQVNQRQTPAAMRDLDDVRVVDLPWLVTPDAPEFAKWPRREYPSAALDRLYALGLDAFQVANAFAEGVPERFDIHGATGRLTLTASRQFAREGRIGVIRGGRLVPFDLR